MDERIQNSQDEKPFDPYVKQVKKKGTCEQIVKKILQDDTQSHGKNESVVYLDSHQLVCRKLISRSELRQLRSDSDNKRVWSVLPCDNEENDYDNLVKYLQNVSESSTSGSLNVETFLFRKSRDSTLAWIRYSDKPEVRVRMNEVTSSKFESEMNDAFGDQTERVKLPMCLEDGGILLLFPVNKSGIMKGRRKERIRKQNAKNEIKSRESREMKRKGPDKKRDYLDRLFIGDKDKSYEFKKCMSFSDSRVVFSKGPNGGSKKKCDNPLQLLQTFPTYSTSRNLENFKCRTRVSVSDRARVLLVKPFEGDVKEYESLVAFLRTARSSKSRSLEKEHLLIPKEREKVFSSLSYSEKPKFRVRINVVTSSMFESAMHEIRENSIETEYVVVHLKDRRKFVLLPVFKEGVLHKSRNGSLLKQVEWKVFRNKPFRLGNQSQNDCSNRTTVGRDQQINSAHGRNTSERTCPLPQNNSSHGANIFNCEMLQAALNTVYNETAWPPQVDSIQYNNPMF